MIEIRAWEEIDIDVRRYSSLGIVSEMREVELRLLLLPLMDVDAETGIVRTWL